MNNAEFKKNIINLYADQERYLNETYDRSLSFQDGLFDRFERAKRLNFGEGASIYNSALVYGQVSVGKKTWIGPNAILDGSGDKIVIGDFCSISAGVHIYTHDSIMWALSGGENDFFKAAVTIGSNTYIGAQSIIEAGVKIGTRCVIGANTFVNRDVSDNSIVVGSPAREIGNVTVTENGIQLIYFKAKSSL